MNSLPVKCQGCEETCYGNCSCYADKQEAMNDSKLLRDMLEDAFSLAGVGV